MPAADLRTMVGGKVRTLSTDEILGGKRVVLFGVPGAFTPACSDTHLPGYLVRAAEIRALGVDTIACVAVNDAFVMDAWGRERGVGDEILMLADGNGDFARAMGLARDSSRFGLGTRSQRFAALVEDGLVGWIAVDDGPGVTASAAEEMLAALRSAS